MFKVKTFTIICCLVMVGVTACGAGELKDDWNDFLHYTKVGRFDLARAYAQAILDANPDAEALLDLTVANPTGYEIMLRVHATQPDAELAALTEQILKVVDQGRNLRRSDPELIVREVERLSSTTPRGRMIALKRLQESGEYAIPFMLDALADPSRRDEFVNVVEALPKIGQSAIRPLAAALQTEYDAVKIEVLKALGKIGYPQALPYLKYVIENDPSSEMKQLAAQSMQDIDPVTQSTAAAELFFNLGENYYYHHASLAPVTKAGKINVWFWSPEKRRLLWMPVDSDIFHEVMAMRCCEWALKADDSFGRSIGLWLAGFFEAEATGLDMPAYFGEGHANAYVYGTTAGSLYLHQALARGLKDQNSAVALAAADALIATAGAKTIFVPVGPVQPLLQALVYDDAAVKTSAAIAIAQAGPRAVFDESRLVVKNLSDAVTAGLETQDPYVERALKALVAVAMQRNTAFDLTAAQEALVAATKSTNASYQMLAGAALVAVNNSRAQQALAEVALNDRNDPEVRVSAFGSLAKSAKRHGSLLPAQPIKAMYTLIGSADTEIGLRTAAAMAFGALNLPSESMKDLILDQAKR